MRLDRPRDAIPHLNAALGQDEEGRLHYRLAQAYRQTGRSDLAASALRKFNALSKRARPLLSDLEITPP
jgi:hypothetical protein